MLLQLFEFSHLLHVFVRATRYLVFYQLKLLLALNHKYEMIC